MSIKLLCGVFLCVPYPCYATCSTLNKDSFTANHMLARPGKDGAHFRSRWGGGGGILKGSYTKQRRQMRQRTTWSNRLHGVKKPPAHTPNSHRKDNLQFAGEHDTSSTARLHQGILSRTCPSKWEWRGSLG